MPTTEAERELLMAAVKLRHPEGPLSTSIEGLHGFFCSVVSGPLIRPTEWMDVLFGLSDEQRGWDSIGQVRDVIDLLMRFYNEVVGEFETGAFSLTILKTADGARPLSPAAVQEWCEGYIFGILLRELDWREATADPAIRPSLDPIVELADPRRAGMDPLELPDAYAHLVRRLPESVRNIHAWWRGGLHGPATAETRRPSTWRATSPERTPKRGW
jgi:yecA family protein